jgi:hypothetical protein
MPGGGHLVTAGFFTIDLGLNNQRVVAFSATLNTDVNHVGFKDTGLFTWSRGTLSLVARTGTVIPGVGTIQALLSPGEEGSTSPFGGGEAINERGQIVFQAALTDGRGVLLLATPTESGNSAATAAAVTSALAAPAAVTDLSGVAVSLVLSGQNTSRLAEVRPTSQLVNDGATAGNASAVVLPPEARISPARESSSAANMSHHRALDDLFATFSQGLWDDALA